MATDREPVSEQAPGPETLYSSNGYQLVLPERQATPEEEGTHLQVRPDGQVEANWQQASLKTMMQEAALAVWPARVVAEFGHTSDAWTNIHWDPASPEGVNVYGRKPLNERSWGGGRGAQPVRKTTSGFDRTEPVNPELRPFLERTMPAWESAVRQMEVFSEGIKTLEPDSEEFRVEMEKYESGDGPVLWANEKFVLVSVNRPHLNGLHLVVHPRDAYWRERGGFLKPWHLAKVRPGERVSLEHQQAFLESVAIAKAAQEIIMRELNSDGYENPELHSSGNWAPDLKHTKHGGKFDGAEYEAASSTRKRTGVLHHTKPQTSYHMHVYIPEQGHVSLPSRPRTEAPTEWEHLKSNYHREPGKPEDEWTELDAAYQKKLHLMQNALREQLSGRLEREASGRLFD